MPTKPVLMLGLMTRYAQWSSCVSFKHFINHCISTVNSEVIVPGLIDVPLLTASFLGRTRSSGFATSYKRTIVQWESPPGASR